MATLADVLVALVAALHAYILVLEMFLWQKKPGKALHGFDPEMAVTRYSAPCTLTSCGRVCRIRACGSPTARLR
ncbi:DUF1304 family protein, partial [Streptomyces sp. NPDC001139]